MMVVLKALGFLLVTLVAGAEHAGAAPMGVEGSVPTALEMPSGARVALRHAGNVPWTGDGLRAGTLRVYCGDGAFIVGLLDGLSIGLNGHTSTWASRATVRMSDGRMRGLLGNEHPGLRINGLIMPGADPVAVNRPISQGISLGLSRCGR
jgi:hypothetical protein